MPTPVIMPKFEMAQETGTVLEWLKGEGDPVQKGEPILSVQTDKVDMEVEAPASGTLAGIRVGAGATVPVGQPIAFILKEGEPLPEEVDDRAEATAETKDESDAFGKAAAKASPVAERLAHEYGVDLATIKGTGPGGRIVRADVEAQLAAQGKVTGQEKAPQDKVKAVPAARRLAHELGVVLDQVSGTGPDGRIQSEDVRRAAEKTPSMPTAEAPAVRRKVPLTGMRRTIADRMTASVREAPQFTLSADVDMSRALAMIDDLRSGQVGEDGPRVTMTAFLIKVCAWSLARHPALNAALQNEDIIEWADINIGVAVAVAEGLVVPVIRHADRLGVREIAARLADLAQRARDNRLQRQDMIGGTFTLSNLGMYAVDRFTAILNPPQAAILAVGRIVKRPLVLEDDRIEARPTMTLTLTADHRVVDGAMAAGFLTTLQDGLQHPGRLLE